MGFASAYGCPPLGSLGGGGAWGGIAEGAGAFSSPALLAALLGSIFVVPAAEEALEGSS